LIGIAQVVEAPVLEVPDLSTPEAVKAYITKEAIEHNIPVERALHVAEKESHFGEDPKGDLDIICKRTGEPVYARGVYQLTRCYYPQVSDEVAFDKQKNIDYVFDNGLLKDGVCQRQFSTCRKL